MEVQQGYDELLLEWVVRYGTRDISSEEYARMFNPIDIRYGSRLYPSRLGYVKRYIDRNHLSPKALSRLKELEHGRDVG